MKKLHIVIMIVLLLTLSIPQVSYAEYNGPPVIITQVELSDPFELFPDNLPCTVNSSGTNSGCLDNVVANHNVECSYYLGSGVCEPIHVRNNLTNTCIIAYGFYSNGTAIEDISHKFGEQWVTLYNRLDQPITVSHFGIFAGNNWRANYYTPVLPYHITNPPSIAPYLVMKPYQSCTYGFLAVNQPLTIKTENATLTTIYQYNGTQYESLTPPLTDNYNDTRTWQFDGNTWTFAEQNTVAVPEFQFAMLVLVISFTSILVFYRFKYRMN